MKAYKILGIAGAVVFIILGFFAVINFSTNSHDKYPLSSGTASSNGAMNPVEERNKWAGLIDKFGPEYAYAEFKKEYAPTHFGIQHAAAHLVGELLYDKLGVDGVTVCDSTFAFGCYHSFFGKALAVNGLSIIKKLDEACIQAYGPLGTGCTHGIGHGLVEYFGHQQLIKALEACTLTTQVKKLFGCTSGVFMEYNVPIVFDGPTAKTEIRELNAANPHEPCNTIVPEKFRESCYYEMGQWWDKVFNKDYKHIGLLCEEAQSEYREPCYLGIGNVAAPSNEYNVQETINTCLLMPNEDAKLLCRAGASWSFFAVPEQRQLSPKLCEGLVSAETHRCAQKADLIGVGRT